MKPNNGKPELYVIGAGATIEEHRCSGMNPNSTFPTMKNFCNLLFEESYVLQWCTAQYLGYKNIPYDDYILHAYTNKSSTGDKLKDNWVEKSPLKIFLDMEKTNPEEFNIESLTRFVWEKVSFSNHNFWSEYIETSILDHLLTLLIENFFVNGKGWKEFKAGRSVAKYLSAGDSVLNLNYDVCFDIAMAQEGLPVVYCPNNENDKILVYKPHGSFNLAVNPILGKFFFCNPEEIPGLIRKPDPEGGTWYPSMGIVPPRSSKEYREHPIAKILFDSLIKIAPKTITFWGVGFTGSDYDLEMLYKKVAKNVERVNIINPDENSLLHAIKLFTCNVNHFKNLSEWLEYRKILFN